jgi:inner membrane protein
MGMDPITHGLVGTVAAQSLANKKKIRPAAITGFISAILADLDYFIHNPSDPLLNIEIHRHFTHSLVFIPVGALIAAGLLWWVMRKYFSFRKLYLFSLVSYGTAGIMDSFTSYGTMLLWPFTDTRFAWNMISVIDPVFTIILAIIIGFAIFNRHRPYVWVAWIWMIIYLTFGFVQRERATTAALQLANERSHQVERIVVKPTIGNLLLWRSIYESEDTFFSDGIRLRLVDQPKYYHGESADRLYPEENYDDYMASIHYYDIMRFDRLSEGYLIHHPEKPNVIGDARYSMLPDSMTPLWGIKIDFDQPEEHVTFHYFRDSSPDIQKQFRRMLMAQE